MAWSSIKLNKTKTSHQKHELVNSFQKGLEILSEEMALLNSIQSILQKTATTGFSHSELDKQLNVKTTILGSYLNSVQQLMRAVKKSLRLIDIVRTSSKSALARHSSILTEITT